MHHDNHRRARPAQRSAFELRVPGSAGRPDRAIPYGVIGTPSANNAPDNVRGAAQSVTVDLGQYGTVTFRPRRPARGARPIPVNVAALSGPLVRGVLRAADIPLYKVEGAVSDIVGALARGTYLPGTRTRVTRDRMGLLTTIPDKGPVTRWVDVDSLAQALVAGLIR